MKKLLLSFALLFTFSSCDNQDLFLNQDYEMCCNVIVYSLNDKGVFIKFEQTAPSEDCGFNKRIFNIIYDANGKVIQYSEYACLSN